MIVELTASRALVHYEGWASRWDEWLTFDSGRIARKGDSGDREGAAGKDGEQPAGKKKAKDSLSSSSAADSSEDAAWLFSSPVSTQTQPADAAAAGSGWTSHSGVNSSRIEQAYQTVLAAAATPSASASLSAPLILRSHRQTLTVDVLSFTQRDESGRICFLKRVCQPEFNAGCFLEDVQCAVTDRQLACLLPTRCPPNLSRRPLLRLFALSGDGQQLPCLGDVRLLVSPAHSLPPSLPSAHTHVSHQLDAQLSSFCFDAANDELLSYHAAEETVRRWRNTGPASCPADTSAAMTEQLDFDDGALGDDEDDSEDEQDEREVAGSPVQSSEASTESSVRIAADVLWQVSAASRLQLSPSSLSSSLQPFCIDVHDDTVAALHRMLLICWRRFRSLLGSGNAEDAADVSQLVDHLRVSLSLLRLLEANVVRLRLFAPSRGSSLPLLISQLRQLLLDMSAVLPSSSAVSTSLSSPPVLSLLSAVGRQCTAALISGFSSFFPTAADIVALVTCRLALPAASAAVRDGLLDSLSSLPALYRLFSASSSDLPRLSSLLAALIAANSRDALSAIERLLSAPPLSQSSPPPLLLSSPLQLLVKLQRCLLSMLWTAEEARAEAAAAIRPHASFTHLNEGWPCDSWQELFRHYLHHLAAVSCELLQCATAASLSDAETAKAMSSALETSMVGALLPSLFVFLSSQSGRASQAGLHESLLPLLQALDRFNSVCSGGQQLKLVEFCSSTPSPCPRRLPPEFRHSSLSSPHPYTAGTLDSVLSVPGARCLALELDGRCCSRNLNDALKLSQGRWSMSCSGSVAAASLSSSSASPHQQAARWPTWMVRRQGDAVAVYWQIDKTDNREKAQHGSDWGFSLTAHGFIPHPMPRVRRRSRSQPAAAAEEAEVTFALDLQLSLTTALVMLARPALASPPAPAAAPAPSLTLLSPLDALSDMSAARPAHSDNGAAETDEDSLEQAVDLSLLSGGLLPDSADADLAQHQQLIEELLGEEPSLRALHSRPPSQQASAPPEPSRSLVSSSPSSPPSLADSLLQLLSSHVPARPAMPASTRQLMAVVERAVVAALLTHTVTTGQALKLLASVSDSYPPWSSSAAARPSSRPSRRALTAEQSALVSVLSPLLSCAYRVESWLLQQAQYDNRWSFLLQEVRHLWGSRPQQQQQPRPAISSEAMPEAAVTVQSLLAAAVAANRAAELRPAEVDSLIREKLHELSADSLARFCAMQHVPFQLSQADRAIAQLAVVVKRAALAEQQTTDQDVPSIQRLVLRVWSMAAFLCQFRCAATPAASKSSSPDAAVLAALFRFLTVGATEMSIAELSALLMRRAARCHARAASFALLSGACTALSLPAVSEALLDSLPQLALDAQLAGCSQSDKDALHLQYARFLQQAMQVAESRVRLMADSSSADDSRCSLSPLDCLMRCGQALLIADRPATALPLVECLLSLHRQLTSLSAAAVEPVLPPPSATLLCSAASASSSSSASPPPPPLCCYALSGSNVLDMEIWSCRSCGFVDSRLVCRSCALSCHAGHDVALVKQGQAFCDCALYTQQRCKGYSRWRAGLESRQECQHRAAQCLALAARLILRAAEQADNAQTQLTLSQSLLDWLQAEAKLVCCSPRTGSELLLHRLLSLVFRLRSRILPPSGTSQLPLSCLLSFLNALLLIAVASSLRCQRLAIRLLGCLLPRLSPSQLAEHSQALPNLDLLPSLPSLSEPAATVSSATLLLSSLLALIGDVVLQSTALQQQSAQPSPSVASTSDDAHATAGMQPAAAAGTDCCQLLLCQSPLPASASSKADSYGHSYSGSAASSSSSSSSAFYSFFADRCSLEVLQYQRAQSQLSDSAAGDGSLVWPSNLDSAPLSQAQKQLDPEYRRAVLRSLQVRQRAVVFEGNRELCEALGAKVAAAGFTVVVQRRRESEARRRNLQAAKLQTESGGWRRNGVSGRQSLLVCHEVLLLLRGLLHPQLSTPDWSQLMRQTLLHSLGCLDSASLLPLTSESGLSATWQPELLLAFGAVSVIAGSTGYDLVSTGSTVRVATRETAGDDATLVGQQPPASCSPASISSALCSPHVSGTVLQIDAAGSEVRVLLDDDERRSASSIHWSRLTAALPSQLSDTAIIPQLADDTLSIAGCILRAVDRLLRAEVSLAAAAVGSSSLASRWLRCLLHSRLLRSLNPLLADASVLHLILTEHAAVLQRVAAAAFFPSIISDLRSLQQEWSRGMETLIDMRTALAARAQSTAASLPSPASADAAVQPPNCWRVASARHCVLSDDLLTVSYCGDRSVSKTRRVKLELEQLMPTLLTAETAWDVTAAASAACPLYFELSLQSEVKGLSFGLAPVQLPPDLSSSPSSRVLFSPLSSSSASSSPSPRHLFGWPEGSVLMTSEGRKARFWHAVRNAATERLRVGDLLDVRDKEGRWQAAQVVAETDSSLTVHWLQWDERWDEQLPRDSERIDSFQSHRHRSPAEQSSVSGQLFDDDYGPPLHAGDVVGCGYSAEQGGVYFTLNGRSLGIAYRKELAPRLLPAVCIRDGDSRVTFTANFTGPFVFSLSEPLSGEEEELERERQGEWPPTAVSDIASSLREFNEPHYTTPSVPLLQPRRLLPYTPPPPPAVYRRHELALSIQQLQLFPDLSLSQLMLALERTGNDVAQAVEFCVLHSSTLQPPVGEEGRRSLVRPVPPPPPAATLFAPATRSMFPSAASSASSSSSFFLSPFNSSDAASEGRFGRSMSMLGHLRRPSPPPLPSPSSSSSSALSPSSLASAFSGEDVDAFDGVEVDDGEADEFSHRRGASSSSLSSQYAVDSAYSLNTLSGPRCTNDYLVSEAAELAGSLQQSRGERLSTLSSLDAVTQSALELVTRSLLEEGFRRHGQPALQIVELLQQLSDRGSDSTLAFIMGGLRPPAAASPSSASHADAGFAFSLSPPSPPEPALPRAELRVGVTVRISPNAKAACVGSIPGRYSENDVVWCSQMDACVGSVGLITAVDADAGLIRVRVSDVERGRAAEWWLPPYALSQLIALRGQAYANAHHELSILPHLLSLQQRSIRQDSRSLLLALLPHMQQLRASLGTQLSADTGLAVSETVQPLSRKESAALATPLWQSPVVPLLSRDVLMVWSLRALQRFVSPDLYTHSIVQPPVPWACSPKRDAEEDAVTGLLSSLSRSQPQLAAQCVQHGLELIKSATVEVEYSAATASASSPSRFLRWVHVPSACCLVVTVVGRLTLATGATLSFFARPHQQRLLYAVEGTQASGKSLSVSLPPFILATNAVWIRLSSDSGSAEPMGEMRLRISPISEQLSAGILLGQHMAGTLQRQQQQQLLQDAQPDGPGAAATDSVVATLSRADRLLHLRLQFDQCVELLSSAFHPPAVVRLPVLRLVTLLVRLMPRGSLGDMASVLPLFRKMCAAYREKARDSSGGLQRLGASAGERRPGETAPLFSPLVQHLFELHCAIVEHFLREQPAPAASRGSATPLQPSFSFNARAAAGLQLAAPFSPPHAAGDHRDADEKREPSGRRADGGSLLWSLSSYIATEQLRQSAPVSRIVEQQLHQDFRWPDWFEQAVSAVLSLQAAVQGTGWIIADLKRGESGIGVLQLPADSGSDWTAEELGGEDEDEKRPTSARCLSLAAYEQLASYLDRRAEQLSKSPLSLSCDDVTGDAAFPSAHRLLQPVPLPLLLYHASGLQALNSLLADALPLVDMSCPSNASSTSTLCSLLIRCRQLIFSSVKTAFLQDVLTETAQPSASSGVLLRINRLKAARAAEPAEQRQRGADRLLDAVGVAADSVIGQTYAQLKGISPLLLRRQRPRGGTPHTGFQVQLEGETVLGQGGPYRQLFSDVCSELQSSQAPLPLLLPTANARHGIGEQRQAFMPNPACHSPQHLELFEHVGRLMGVACRTKLLLALDLPPLFWKQLAGERPVRADLQNVDSALLDAVLTPGLSCQSEEEFDAVFGPSSLSFPVTTSDGRPVVPSPLVPVTFATLPGFLSALEEARLSESRQQVEAMRRGLSDLVPLSLLPLFTAQQLCSVFCGSASIDVALLRRHTEYSGGLSESSREVQWFWSVLGEMDDAHRRAFVSFAYAQSRLPADDAGFSSFPKIRMLLKPSRSSAAAADSSMPRSDTCFFNVELPAYSSLQVMRQRLMQVCEMGAWGLSGDEAPPMADIVMQQQHHDSGSSGSQVMPASTSSSSAQHQPASASSASPSSFPPLPAPPLAGYPESVDGSRRGAEFLRARSSSTSVMGTEMRAMTSSSSASPSSSASSSSAVVPLSFLPLSPPSSRSAARSPARPAASASNSPSNRTADGAAATASHSVSSSSSSVSPADSQTSAASTSASFSSALSSSFRQLFSRGSRSSVSSSSGDAASSQPSNRGRAEEELD